MAPSELLGDERQQRHVAGALHSTRHLALVAVTCPGHAALQDLAAIRDEITKPRVVLVADVRDLVNAEGTDLALRPAEAPVPPPAIPLSPAPGRRTSTIRLARRWRAGSLRPIAGRRCRAGSLRPVGGRRRRRPSFCRTPRAALCTALSSSGRGCLRRPGFCAHPLARSIRWSRHIPLLPRISLSDNSCRSSAPASRLAHSFSQGSGVSDPSPTSSSSAGVAPASLGGSAPSSRRRSRPCSSSATTSAVRRRWPSCVVHSRIWSLPSTATRRPLVR